MPATKQIFFSYSDFQQDKDLYSKINRHFSLYVRNKLVSIIDKDEIFKQSADKSVAFDLLKKSDIAVPLLSSDFLANDDCLNLLVAAVSEKKVIIPVLLRDVDVDADTELRSLKKDMLPADGKSILQHFDTAEDDDEILTVITKRIKAIAFREFEAVRIVERSKLFYYILSAIVIGMGICAARFVYDELTKPSIPIAIFIFLLFLCIALFALKNVLFPTDIKRN